MLLIEEKEQGICGKQKGDTFNAQYTETFLILFCQKHEVLYHSGTKVIALLVSYRCMNIP